MAQADISRNLAAVTSLTVAVLLLASCSRGFSSFVELDKLRVLGVRAEPPALGPGEVAVLDALVFEPDGDEVTYHWSWCPLAAGAQTGFQCYLDEELLRALAEERLPGASELIPSFDLGTEPVVEFAYPLPAPLLKSMCEAATSQELPSFVPLPDCSRGLTITVRLEVSAGGESVVAVKSLPLFWEAADADNANPEVSGLRAALGAGAPFELRQDGTSVMEAGVRYDLEAAVDESVAQLFTPDAIKGEPAPEPRLERLFMTWFITGGETDSRRTTFIDGDVGFDVLRRNRWRPPSLDDAEDETASIYLVLQDERGGVGWLGRTVGLEER